MKITNFEEFVILLENLIIENNTIDINSNLSKIEIEGIAAYKDYIFEVVQYIDNSIDYTALSPLKQRLYDSLIKMNQNDRNNFLHVTLSSYFTPITITDCISEKVLNYLASSGKKNISVLEPSAGSGRFIDSLIDKNNSLEKKLDLSIDAIELDKITAAILKHNSKDHKNISVYNKAYQDFTSDKKYDLIISNIPFGQYGISDFSFDKKKRDLINGKVHNYFFIKASEQLTPGGTLVFITSKEIADSINEIKLREYLVENLNLIDAIRLPEESFKQAKTKVLTDVLIFQKPFEIKNAISDQENLFINSLPFSLPGEKTVINVNSFYLNNLDNLLGSYYPTKGIKGIDTYSLKSNSDNFENLLNERLIGSFQNNVFTILEDQIISNELEQNFEAAEQEHLSIINNYPLAIKGNLIVLNNQFYKVEQNPHFVEFFDKTPVEFKVTDRERALALIELRESYKLMREFIRVDNLEQAKIQQSNLNQAYDSFVFFYNNINSKENTGILYLEIEKEILKSFERKITPDEYQKSDIFSSEEYFKDNTNKIPDDVQQAIYLSLNNYGLINIDYIDNLYRNKERVWIREALKENLLYINPLFNDDYTKIENFELALKSTFLSGYIEGKISVYNSIYSLKDADISFFTPYIDKSYIDKSKQLLIDNIPYKLTINEIDPNLGETWVNNSIFELFGKEHLEDNHFKIYYNDIMDSYKVSTRGSIVGTSNYSVSVSGKTVPYTHIFKFALEQNSPDFKKKIPVGDNVISVSNKELNTAVTLSVEKLQLAFTKWLLQKEDLSKYLEEKYHLLNNAIVKEQFDTTLVDFKEINGYAPYQHQINATMQNVMTNGGIIDHKVGFGKTLTMAMITMTKKKFNINQKELVVGLNSNYVNIYNAFVEAYPEGKFLLVRAKDMTPENKVQTFYNIANNNWDAVIVSHSSLMRFPKDPYNDEKVINDIINEIKATIENDKSERFLTTGDMNKLLKKLANAEADQKDIQKIIDDRKQNGTLIFDDLRIDGMLLDESQYFKNLEFSTRHTRIAGLGGNQKTQKTRNLLSYIRNIQHKNKGKGKFGGVSFVTGTTISNSLSELFSLFKYLIPEELNKKGMNTFDQWARVYARKTSEFEESVSGKIKQKERFRYFVKVPELAKMYYDMTHFADEGTFKIKKPEIVYNMIPVTPHQELNEYLDCLKKFGETKNFDNLPYYKSKNKSSKAVGLICTSLGRKASLSLKLINKNLNDSPDDKLGVCTSKVIEIYNKYNHENGTQLLFCDQGVPGTGKSFIVYEYVKNLLIEKGVPAEEIAFIHSYEKKKAALYNKVNAGTIRIVIGSTEKMGVGVNMQEKLTALHHLDLPWRPSDLEQRNGRGDRPGNLLLPKYDNKIETFFYATKGTLDSYSFNLLQIKQNFINQIKNASISTRKIDEGAIDAKGGMNFQEYMAACSPNQYLTQKLKVEKELQQLKELKSAHELRNRQNKNKINITLADLVKVEKNRDKLNKDLISSKNFNPTVVDGVSYNSEKEIAEALNQKLNKIIKSNGSINSIALNNGFSFLVQNREISEKLTFFNYQIFLITPAKSKISFKSRTFTKKDSEVASYALNCMDRIKTLLKEYNNNIDYYNNQIKTYEAAINVKFDKDDKIKELNQDIKRLEKLIEGENKNLQEPPEEYKKESKNVKIKM